jgi:transposase-like protein
MDFPDTNSKILLIFQIQNFSTIHVLYVARLTLPISFDVLYDYLVDFKSKQQQMPSLLICTPEKILMETSLAVFRGCQIQICLDSLLNWIKKTSNDDNNQELEQDIADVLHQKDLNRFVQTYTSVREKWKSDHPCLMDEMDGYLPFIIPMYQYQHEIRPFISTVKYAQKQLISVYYFLKDRMDIFSSEKTEMIPYQINSHLRSFPLDPKDNGKLSS